MEALPSLVGEADDLKVARLIERAARDVPPDRESPLGLRRRGLLTRVILTLLTPASGPIAPEAARIASGLLDVLDFRPGEPDRRAIEEQLWVHLQRAPASATLRDLAAKVGFAVAAPEA